MIAQEDGPFDIFVKFRNSLGVRYSQANRPYGQNWISRGIICVWCVSFWIGLAAVGLWEYSHSFLSAGDFIATWLALSAAAIFVDSVISSTTHHD